MAPTETGRAVPTLISSSGLRGLRYQPHRAPAHPAPIQFEGALTFNFWIGTFLMGRLLNPATARSRGLMIDLLA